MLTRITGLVNHTIQSEHAGVYITEEDVIDLIGTLRMMHSAMQFGAVQCSTDRESCPSMNRIQHMRSAGMLGAMPLHCMCV
jgi:hypothetical protein